MGKKERKRKMQECIMNASLNNKMQHIVSESKEWHSIRIIESPDCHHDMHCLQPSVICIKSACSMVPAQTNVCTIL